MSAKPFRTIGTGLGISNLKVFDQRAALPIEAIVQEAGKIEDLLSKLLYSEAEPKDAWDIYTEDDSKLKNLNSFGKQVVTRMLRSNPGFQGFRLEFTDPILKPDVLFLIGTLCNDFDHMNTSPLYGYNVLDVGCGALSSYTSSEEKENLLEQFYSDHPPIAPELLQILGAHTVGVDPRPNSKDIYAYQVSYKHRMMEFSDVGKWLTALDYQIDVMSCLNLFSKLSFAYHYNSPKQISQFLDALRRVISPGGLLYSTPPTVPSSSENKQINRQIFDDAGFKVLYEGYYLILQPA